MMFKNNRPMNVFFDNQDIKQGEGRKIAQWNVIEADSGSGEYDPYIEVACSNCNLTVGIECGQYGWYYGEPFPWNFCPNCGVCMINIKSEKDDVICVDEAPFVHTIKNKLKGNMK